jgi:hypothetical protein
MLNPTLHGRDSLSPAQQTRRLMVNGKLAGQSRWVLQALWVIAAALAATILSVRNKGFLSENELSAAGVASDASRAFAVRTASRVTAHSFDALTWDDHVPVSVKPGVSTTLATVAAGTTVTLTGWAFNTATNSDFPAIGARVSGSPAVFSALVGLSRPDVASALHNPAARNSGFRLNIDTSHLALGRHAVTVRALGPNRQTAMPLGPALAIDITNSSAAQQRTDAIDSLNGVVVNAAASASSPVAVLRSYGRLSVSGWGFVTRGQRLAGSITLLVDGNPAAAARYGISRPDVARQYNDVRLARSGFQGSVQMDSLTLGPHEIQLQLGLSDGTTIPSSSVLHVKLL